MHKVDKNIIDTLILVALPASGKSETRKYMLSVTPEVCNKDFHMGYTAQLDDYPYVHFMRCIDDALHALKQDRVFFHSPDRPFKEPRHWGTLIHLLNEDYVDIHAHKQAKPANATEWLLDRIDAAGAKVGIEPKFKKLSKDIRNKAVDLLEKEAQKILVDWNENNKQDLTGKTIVMECARGGADGSTFPLKAPFGYLYSLAELSDEVLSRAKILYIWVTPEESRRKNHERTDPNDPGSILNHGVPIEVMMKDYGCDDMTWLEEKSEKKGTITVKAHNKTYYLPIARFDNRVDRTSFIRNDKKNWKPEQVKLVHEGLKEALTRLASYK